MDCLTTQARLEELLGPRGLRIIPPTFSIPHHRHNLVASFLITGEGRFPQILDLFRV